MTTGDELANIRQKKIMDRFEARPEYGGSMCGRYYIDGDAIDEAGIFTNRKYPINLNRTTRDIYPSQYAPILARGSDISPDDSELALQIQEMRWGFPQYTGKGLFINARSETAMERKTFRESVLMRRCVVISRHFYEWDAAKEKVTFKREDEAVIYMAGFFNVIQNELKFVILTTAANSSMISVHDRMPLILEQDEVSDWICNVDAARRYLNKVPLALKQEREYEQQSLF